MYIYARTEQPEPPNPYLPLWLTLLATVGAMGGFCWVKQDYVAAAVLAIMMVCGLWGYYVGALRLMAYFTSLAAVYAFTWPVTQFLQPHIAGKLGASPGMTKLISLLASAIGIFLLTSITLAYISRRLLRDRPQVDWANRILGFGVGALQGTAAMLVLLGGIQVTEPHANRQIQVAGKEENKTMARVVSEGVVDIASSTRHSSIGFLVTNYNPFEKVPELRNLQRTVSVVSDPYRLAKVMRSPAVKRLKNDPDVRGAIESLAKDPELRKLAQSGKLLDQKTALALLNNPNVAKLLENPELIRHFTEAMCELDSLAMK